MDIKVGNNVLAYLEIEHRYNRIHERLEKEHKLNPDVENRWASMYVKFLERWILNKNHIGESKRTETSTKLYMH